jgi:hypothetical protein
MLRQVGCAQVHLQKVFDIAPVSDKHNVQTVSELDKRSTNAVNGSDRPELIRLREAWRRKLAFRD